VLISWPDGEQSEVLDLPVDTSITVVRGR